MGSKLGAAAAMALVWGVALSTGAALAQDNAQAQAVKARQQNFKQLGGAFKAIIDELKKNAPDKAVLTANAQKMNALATQEASWFPRGSGREALVKTSAKPEIWSDPAGFAAAIQRLQGESAKLQLAAGGDLDAFKLQVRATGGACKNCHDKYRVPDQH